MQTQSAGDATNVIYIPALRHYDISDDTRALFNGIISGIAVNNMSRRLSTISGKLGPRKENSSMEVWRGPTLFFAKLYHASLI